MDKIDINQVEITSLCHIRGQPQVIETLSVNLRAYYNIRATSRNSPPTFGPVLFGGPTGAGKTLVARALHAELANIKWVETNGETVNHRLELCSILMHADENTTVFIDEAQGMNAKTQHLLLTAISERKLYVPAGIYTSRSQAIPLSNFTLILATTHEYLLQEALRNRMRIYCRFTYYTLEDLIEIVRQRAHALQWPYESEEVLTIIAQRAKGIPRLALNTNLQMCWNVTKSCDREMITLADVHAAFRYLQIDELGLDELDRSYLRILEEYGQVSLSVLSSKLSLPAATIQRVVEPYLLKEGFILKQKSSLREITAKGKKHIGNISP